MIGLTRPIFINGHLMSTESFSKSSPQKFTRSVSIRYLWCLFLDEIFLSLSQSFFTPVNICPNGKLQINAVRMFNDFSIY